MPQDDDAAAPGIAISRDASDTTDDKQLIGRRIWEIVPYLKHYWKRVVGGIAANAAARAFDLIPMIAIGMAADYYQSGTYTSGMVESLVNSSQLPSAELGFGLLILVSFCFLAVFQGLSEYAWQSTAYKVQHDIRMDATTSLMAMEASRTSGNCGRRSSGGSSLFAL